MAAAVDTLTFANVADGDSDMPRPGEANVNLPAVTNFGKGQRFNDASATNNGTTTNLHVLADKHDPQVSR